MANDQDESGIEGEAELRNMVAVVDTVAKDVDLQQRLTSSVNQLARMSEEKDEEENSCMEAAHQIAKCQLFYTEQNFQTKFYPKKNSYFATTFCNSERLTRLQGFVRKANSPLAGSSLSL